MTKRNNH